MLMRKDGDSKLVVFLQPDDLSELDITFERFDYKNEETRKIISDILSRAREEQSFDSSGKKLIIEVYPAEGGCEIIFEAADRELPIIQICQSSSAYIYRFASSEELYTCLEAVGEKIKSVTLSTALYLSKQSYFGVFLAVTGKSKILKNTLSEYAEYQGSGKQDIARLDEYGQLLLVCRDLSTQLLKKAI